MGDPKVKGLATTPCRAEELAESINQRDLQPTFEAAGEPFRKMTPKAALSADLAPTCALLASSTLLTNSAKNTEVVVSVNLLLLKT